MKRILIIGYHFYPAGGPRAQHTLGIVNGFCKNGWAVDLVLPREERQNDFRLDQAPDNLTIHLIDVSRFFVQRVLRKLFKAVSGVSGQDFACKSLKYVTIKGLSDKADGMLTIADPFATHLAGLLIKSKNKRLFWIADYGDPYSFRPRISPFKTPKIKILLEKHAVKFMHRIIIPIDAAKNAYYKVGATDDQLVVIPQLFENKIEDAPYIFEKTRINIVYTGIFYGNERSPIEFLKAYKKLIDEGKPLAFHFFGEIDSLEFFLNDLDLDKYKYNIYVSERIPRPQALDLIRKADLLLNINNLHKEQMPSKVIDYINSGIRVLNVGNPLFDEFINVENHREAIYAVLSKVKKEERLTDYGELALEYNYDNNLKKYLAVLDNAIADIWGAV